MKNNKKLIIILIVLSIGVLFCASLIVYKHSFNNIPENIIDIDDCTNKDCDKNNKCTYPCNAQGIVQRKHIHIISLISYVIVMSDRNRFIPDGRSIPSSKPVSLSFTILFVP